MDFKQIFNTYLGFVNRLIPKHTQVPVVGIDIGTSYVKAVQITKPGNAFVLDAWGIERIEGGNAPEALRKLLAGVDFSSEKVPVTSVSGKGTLIRYMDMPQMPLEDLRKSLTFDLDKYFPFDPQSIYTDCAILDQKPKEKKMSVLVVAVKKEIIDERIKLFKEAGLELGHITVNSIALANAFSSVGPTVVSSANAKAVLDIGGAVSNISMIKDASPLFTRDIFIGNQDITLQAANILGVEASKPEELNRTIGQQTSEVLEAFGAAVSNLVGEVRLSLDYFMTEKNIQVDEMYLLGGGSLTKGMEHIFEKQLGMSVRRWDPLALVQLGASATASDVRTFSSQLGVAIGLGVSKV